MGAGGAARRRGFAAVGRRRTALVVANRTLEKAQKLGKAFAARGRIVSVSSYAGLRTEFDIVINATSSGLTDEMPPLPTDIFAPGALAYDMMYGRETPFMKFAREQVRAAVSDGLGMLVEQAAESFYIWRGVRPDTAPVIAARA